MAKYYSQQFVGVADGTKQPPDKADGRQCGAKDSTTVVNKVAGQAWASGDQIYIGKVRQGELLISLTALLDTSLGAATLSIGTLANPTKYANAMSATAVGSRVPLGPLVASVIAGPLTADEDIWVTIGGAAVPGSTNAAFFIQTVGIR